MHVLLELYHYMKALKVILLVVKNHRDLNQCRNTYLMNFELLCVLQFIKEFLPHYLSLDHRLKLHLYSQSNKLFPFLYHSQKNGHNKSKMYFLLLSLIDKNFINQS
jgi:hypothetical protein